MTCDEKLNSKYGPVQKHENFKCNQCNMQMRCSESSIFYCVGCNRTVGGALFDPKLLND